MGKWNFVALVTTGIGFQMTLLAIIVSDAFYISADDAVEACLIIGFLMYTISFMGLLLYNFGDTPLKSNKYTLIGCAVALFLAGEFMLPTLVLLDCIILQDSTGKSNVHVFLLTFVP